MLGKLQDGQGTDPALVEEISIFQNKIGTHMPNKMLENIRKNMAESSGNRAEESKGMTNNAALWSIAENSQTVSSTLKENPLPFD